MDRGSWWATVLVGLQSQTRLKQLSMYTWGPLPCTWGQVDTQAALELTPIGFPGAAW